MDANDRAQSGDTASISAQATGTGSPERRNEEGEVDPSDPRLNFLSPEFDALLALHTPGVEPPDAAARPLDNVAKARVLVPGEYAPRAPSALKADEVVQDRELSRRAVREHVAARERLRAPLLQALADRVAEGPLLLLKRCLREGARVRVVTRHARGVRGVATGTLRAFDRHMNLVLRDVEERYVVALREPRCRPPECGSGAGPSVEAAATAAAAAEATPQQAAPSAQAKPAAPQPAAAAGESLPSQHDQLGKQRVVRWRRRIDHRTRTLKQVLLRGDSVVMVSEAGAPGAAIDASCLLRRPSKGSQ